MITIFEDLKATKAEHPDGGWTAVVDTLIKEPPHATKAQCRLFSAAT